MKRLLSLAVIFMIAALLCFFTAVLAQEPAAVLSPVGTTKKEPAVPVSTEPGVQYKQIRVLKGGNLALIAERCGQTQAGWRPLADINQQLPKAERVGEMWRVWIQPRQILNLPVGWSYQTLQPGYIEPFPPVPPKPAPKKTPAVVSPLSDAGGGSLWLANPLVWALILLVAALAVLFWPCGSMSWFRRRDPSRYPAVIPGGLADDPRTATEQVAAAYPRLIASAEQAEIGHFVNDYGPDRVLAGMTIQGGAEREVYVRPGEPVYRLMRNGRAIWHALMRCGNALRLKPPAGWRFVGGQAVDIAQPTPPVPPVHPVFPIPPAPVSPVSPVPPAHPTQPIPPTPPVPPIPPAPVFSAEPEPVPDPEPESEPESVPKPTAEQEEIKSPRKVKVTVGDFSIEVVGNGKVPATKVEMEEGTTVILRQEE